MPSRHILFLTPQLPYPPQQGTALRNYYILRGLAEHHRLALLSFAEEPPADLAPLRDLCQPIELVPLPGRTTRQRLERLFRDPRPDMSHRLQSQAFEQALSQMLGQQKYDVVQVEGIELARYIPLIRQASPASKILFDNHNAEAELQYRAFLADLGRPGRWPAAAYSFIQAGRLRRFEAWACQHADWVTCVSEQDKSHLQSLVPGLPVWVVPNCVDISRYQLPAGADTPRFDLLFSGKMDYRPNIDAMLWFGREIWPRLLAARPGTTWAIVGQKPHARLDELKRLPGVTITGRVDQVQPYLAGAGLYIMPFRVGSGTRLKLIEAMAAGLAIVSTRLGAEGFAVQHGQEIWLADTAQQFADGVLGLLFRPEQAQQLGQAARQFAAQYDWRQIIPRFEAILNDDKGL